MWKTRSLIYALPIAILIFPLVNLAAIAEITFGRTGRDGDHGRDGRNGETGSYGQVTVIKNLCKPSLLFIS
jgi:hypothetical protein